MLGKTAPRHTSEQFVAFLTDLVASQPARREIHVICDNVCSHKTERVNDFLAEHRNVRMHFTPTYSSWLNQVENWFSRIQRGRHQPRHLHVGEGSQPKNDALHPRTQQESKADQVEV